MYYKNINIKNTILNNNYHNHQKDAQNINEVKFGFSTPYFVRDLNTNDSKMLKRIVRRELGWIKYAIMGRHIITAMKEVGADLTCDELETAELYGDNDSFTIYNGEKYYEL